jgi:DNA-binding MarR family transcriptional regulator
MALTPKGKTLLASAVPVWERTHKEVEALLQDGDAARFRSNLRALS